MAEIKCIDVSEWQGKVDWKKVKAAGVNYAVLRAGFGREASQIDAEFERNYKNAKASGVELGVYWYSYADSVADAQNEAKACLAVLKGKSFELPVFFDMEDSSQTGFGKATLTAMATKFCDIVKKSGYKTGVYANLNWFSNYLDYAALKKKYYIWLAQYHTEPQLDCDMWQYTSSGKVNGVQGNTDMNIIYSSELVNAPSEEKPEETAESFELVALQALLKLSNRLGLIEQTIPSLDNKSNAATKAAILQMKKAVGMKEDNALSLQFVTKTYQAIVDGLPIVGDVNGDGKVNIRDATALQKQIAGVDDV